VLVELHQLNNQSKGVAMMSYQNNSNRNQATPVFVPFSTFFNPQGSIVSFL